MAALDSLGMLASGIVAAIVMLVFAILSLFVTVFIVDAAAGIAGLEPNDGAIVIGGSLLAAATIIAGGAGVVSADPAVE